MKTCNLTMTEIRSDIINSQIIGGYKSKEIK